MNQDREGKGDWACLQIKRNDFTRDATLKHAFDIVLCLKHESQYNIHIKVPYYAL